VEVDAGEFPAEAGLQAADAQEMQVDEAAEVRGAARPGGLMACRGACVSAAVSHTSLVTMNISDSSSRTSRRQSKHPR
jgi:hypothetical protein